MSKSKPGPFGGPGSLGLNPPPPKRVQPLPCTQRACGDAGRGLESLAIVRSHVHPRTRSQPSGRPPQCGHLLWGLGRRAGPCEARDQQTKLADRLPHELTFGELTFGERPGPSWSPTRLIHATETDSRHSEQACGRPGGGGREGRDGRLRLADGDYDIENNLKKKKDPTV